MKTYINTLAQTKGMFEISPYLTRSAFRDYTKSLEVYGQKRSLQALGIIERIRDYNLKSHIAQTRSEGFTNYKVTIVRQIKKKTFSTMPEKKLDKIANVFNQQLGRLTGLVDNLLDVSRGRADRLLLSKEELNVTEVVQGIVEKFRLQGMTSDTAITFNAPESIVGLLIV